MKKIKKWLTFAPACLFLLSVSSCSLAQGTYLGQKEQTLGVALQEGQHKGEFVYKINTENNQNVFSSLNVTIRNSRLTYEYGQYNVQIVVSLSKTEDFSNSVSVSDTIDVGEKLTNVVLSFVDKADEIEALAANELYVKIEVIGDDNDNSFKPSWIVLGDITISGSEKLKGGDVDEKVYLNIDYSADNVLDNALLSENVEIDNGKLVASRLGQLAYVDYEVSTEHEGNGFETLSLKISESTIKSSTRTENQENEDGETVEVEVEDAKTYINAYVSSDPTTFTAIAGTIESTVEGVTDGTIDLTEAVSGLSTQKIYVRIELAKDGDKEITDTNNYLNVGKVAFVAEESKKVEAYLSKDLKNGLNGHESSLNIVKHEEPITRQDIILKGGNKSQIITYTFDENGNVTEKTESKVGFWEEKGVKYSENVVAGLNESQLALLLADSRFSFADGVDHYKEGFIEYDTNPNTAGAEYKINVYINKVADSYYELVFDVVKWIDANTTTDLEGMVTKPSDAHIIEIQRTSKAVAYTYTSKVFNDYTMGKGGNVIYVEVEGQRELYIHTEKVIQRISDLKTFKRK